MYDASQIFRSPQYTTYVILSKNASAMVLSSGKELQEHTEENSTKRGHAQKRKPEKEVEIPQDQDEETKEDNPKVLVTLPPFSERFTKSKKDEEAKEILETFCKVEVNIPLLDAIKQIPRCAKFIKELCTSKGKFKGNERVNELVLPADFYVLDMREDNSPNSTSILLGRPFFKIARTKIDVRAGTLTMEFDGEIIRFNIFDSMRYPSDIPIALFVDAFDPFVQNFPAIGDKDYTKFALEKSPTPMEEGNMGVDPFGQVNAKFDGDSVFLAKINTVSLMVQELIRINRSMTK
ncbi:UNVERIFIED_CONTAM: hypothetical protein Sangu_2570000 [Sesamum angustifolium]|uniref:Uncharacterized protein n=1 Tax=Sesamum angustifolium TaxID=2727405 RepID=A0AAW2JAC6_9LAMI